MGIGGPLGLFATFPVVCKPYLLAGDSLLIFMGLGGGRDYEIPEIGLGLPNKYMQDLLDPEVISMK